MWRLQNGELPPSLSPQVFWILIGINDIGIDWCTPEVALLGILRVIEEILSKRTDAMIVLNGILPTTYERKRGFLNKSPKPTRFPVIWKDIQAINEQLRNYSTNRERVTFFNVPELFLKENGIQINKERMTDFLHPSSQGYKAWGDEIVELLDSLMSPP